MRRLQRHVALDAPALEEALEHLLAAPLGPHDQVLGGAEGGQRQRLRSQRVIAAHHTRPVLRGDAPLAHRLERQRREIADGQVHFSLFQLVGQLRRGHRHRTDAAVRRAGAQRRHHAGEKRHLTDVGKGQRPGARARVRVEALAAQQIFLQAAEQRAREPHDRMRAGRRRDTARDPDEERIVEGDAHPLQRHADGGLAHAEEPGGAADAQLVVEGKRDRQQVQVRGLHRGVAAGLSGRYESARCGWQVARWGRRPRQYRRRALWRPSRPR